MIKHKSGLESTICRVHDHTALGRWCPAIADDNRSLMQGASERCTTSHCYRASLSIGKGMGWKSGGYWSINAMHVFFDKIQ